MFGVCLFVVLLCRCVAVSAAKHQYLLEMLQWRSMARIIVHVVCIALSAMQFCSGVRGVDGFHVMPCSFK